MIRPQAAVPTSSTRRSRGRPIATRRASSCRRRCSPNAPRRCSRIRDRVTRDSVWHRRRSLASDRARSAARADIRRGVKRPIVLFAGPPRAVQGRQRLDRRRGAARRDRRDPRRRSDARSRGRRWRQAKARQGAIHLHRRSQRRRRCTRSCSRATCSCCPRSRRPRPSASCSSRRWRAASRSSAPRFRPACPWVNETGVVVPPSDVEALREAIRSAWPTIRVWRRGSAPPVRRARAPSSR